MLGGGCSTLKVGFRTRDGAAIQEGRLKTLRLKTLTVAGHRKGAERRGAESSRDWNYEWASVT